MPIDRERPAHGGQAVKTLLAAALALPLLLTGCATSGHPLHGAGTHAAPTTFMVHGTVLAGLTNYNISEGADVTITDSHGTTIATTKLGIGHMTRYAEYRYPFDTTVPAGRGFYGIQVTGMVNTVHLPESQMRRPAIEVTG